MEVKEIRKSIMVLTSGLMLALITMSLTPVLAQVVVPGGAQWQPFYMGSPHYYGEVDDPKYPGYCEDGGEGTWWEAHKQYAGKVFIWNDEANLYIYIDTTQPATSAGAGLMEVHIDIQSDPEDFPMTKKNNPKVGKFAYKDDGLGGAQDYLLTVALEDLPDGLVYIAVHAALTNGETAWANCGGCEAYFDGGNWATFFDYTIE
jgi:hypothetical protein